MDAGADAVQLLARLGTGFTSEFFSLSSDRRAYLHVVRVVQWVAHAFAAPGLVGALTRVHGHTATGKTA